MTKDINQQKIAILATDGVEQSELTEPRKALDEAGAKTELISIKAGEIKGWNHTEWGETFTVDKLIDDVDASEYDGLVLPGGVMNPDKLRMNAKAVSFVKKIFDEGKPVAAICHGPWLLIEAGVVNGRKVTSWPSLQTDLRNAGAQWEDSEVVVDQGLVTSRKPDDLPAFNSKMLEEFKEGPHPRQ
jgi:protease I